MQRKAMMGMAAVAGIALLMYIRRKGASADAASASGVLTSNAALINAAMGNVWGGAGGSAAPAPAPSPAPAPVADAHASSAAPVSTGGSKFTTGGPSSGPPAAEVPKGKYNYVAEISAGQFVSAPVVDDARVAALDGVRNFVNGRDVFDAGVLDDIVSAARGQGMGYWETMRTLGEAYSKTPNQISQHMSQYGGISQW